LPRFVHLGQDAVILSSLVPSTPDQARHANVRQSRLSNDEEDHEGEKEEDHDDDDDKEGDVSELESLQLVGEGNDRVAPVLPQALARQASPQLIEHAPQPVSHWHHHLNYQ
jgi:hypothetical protein